MHFPFQFNNVFGFLNASDHDWLNTVLGDFDPTQCGVIKTVTDPTGALYQFGSTCAPVQGQAHLSGAYSSWGSVSDHTINIFANASKEYPGLNSVISCLGGGIQKACQDAQFGGVGLYLGVVAATVATAGAVYFGVKNRQYFAERFNNCYARFFGKDEGTPLVPAETENKCCLPRPTV